MLDDGHNEAALVDTTLRRTAMKAPYIARRTARADNFGLPVRSASHV